MEIIATTKITNRDGIKAIRNGQKLNKYSDIPSLKKPSWLKVKAEFNPNFHKVKEQVHSKQLYTCLLYTSPSPRDGRISRMPSSA